MNKRLMLALGIWLAIFIVWTTLTRKDPKKPKSVKKNLKKSGKVTKDKASKKAGKKIVFKQTGRAKALTGKGRSITVNTKKYSVGLNKIDGTVDSWKLKGYKDGGETINFIEKNYSFFRNFKVSFQGLKDADKQQEVLFSHKKESKLKHSFTKRLRSGLTLKKTYTFYPEKNYIDLSVEFQNRSGRDKTLANNDIAYSLIWGSSIDWKKDKKRKSTYDIQELKYLSDKGDLEEGEEKTKSVNAFRWIGMHDRYFLLAVIPVEKNGAVRTLKKVRSAYVSITKKKDKAGTEIKLSRFALNRETMGLSRNRKSVDYYRIFLGPKKYALLNDTSVASYELDKILKTSFPLLGPVITWLGNRIEQLMYLVHGNAINFGLVIILVTIIIKLLLHPLTHKSTVSMRKMQLLQPKITALKEQYKSDSQMMNRKMMELYKKEKVNPMGGCLPILLQIPIFISLYRVLPRMIDLKNVSFLWIKDLSSPDTVATIEAFKNIPLIPMDINILPLIMTVFGVIQSKLSTATQPGAVATPQQGPGQGKMMMFMQVFILFILYKMPAGLILYWTTQTILAILQQLYINKKMDVPAPEAAE